MVNRMLDIKDRLILLEQVGHDRYSMPINLEIVIELNIIALASDRIF